MELEMDDLLGEFLAETMESPTEHVPSCSYDQGNLRVLGVAPSCSWAMLKQCLGFKTSSSLSPCSGDLLPLHFFNDV